MSFFPKKLLEHGQTHFLLSISIPFKLEGSFGGSKAFNILWAFVWVEAPVCKLF